MSGLVIFLLLLVGYILIVYALNATGRLGGSLELMGPFLMMRTQRGKPTIDRISKWKRFWAVFGDVGIVLTAIAGILMLLMLVLQLVLFLSSPRLLAENAPSAEYLIGLPGVNPLIPLWYGLFGLIVALVVHEGCHGILSRHANIRVKSLGLLWFIVPIGAFVEPDEGDLERGTPRQRNRMFAAGPTSNLVLALGAAILFSNVVMASVSVPMEGEGVIITGVEPGYGAAEGGVEPGSILTHIDGKPVPDRVAFNETLSSVRYDPAAPPTINLTLVKDGATKTVPVTLTSKYDYYQKLHESGRISSPPPASFREQGFLGVTTFDIGTPGNPGMGSIAGLKELLENPLSHGLIGFNFYVYYPFFALSSGLDILNAPYNGYLEVGGIFSGMNPTLFFILANTLYWLFWLNLMLGTFNALPAGPLDGGHIFRTSVRSLMWRLYGVDPARTRVEANLQGPGVRVTGVDEETQRKLDRAQAVVKRASMSLGLFILALILMPIVAPRLILFLLG